MRDNKEEIEFLFKKMLKDQEEKAPEDKIYQKDIKDVGKFKVQWKICGILGYQIFDMDKITYKFGETLEDPDVTLVIRDNKLAPRLLKGEVFEFESIPGYKNEFKINYAEGWKILETETGKKRVRKLSKPFVIARFNEHKKYHPFVLSRLPIFRKIVVGTRKTENDIGYYIPINQSVGTFESQILPVKVIKSFIDKASSILILHQCGCRKLYDCKDHDKGLGCMYMGDDTLKILIPKDKGHVATKEEALERVKLAVDDGLIPLIGRAMDEAAGFGVEDTGHFMSMCFCCPCCCTNVRNTKYATSAVNFFRRIEGLNVMVDKDLCTGCGECVKVCVFDAMELKDEVANLIDEKCMGCGRCEDACPSNAISLKIDDSSSIYELINKLESHVDVTPSSTS